MRRIGFYTVPTVADQNAPKETHHTGRRMPHYRSSRLKLPMYTARTISQTANSNVPLILRDLREICPSCSSKVNGRGFEWVVISHRPIQSRAMRYQEVPEVSNKVHRP